MTALYPTPADSANPRLSGDLRAAFHRGAVRLVELSVVWLGLLLLGLLTAWVVGDLLRTRSAAASAVDYLNAAVRARVLPPREALDLRLMPPPPPPLSPESPPSPEAR